MRDSDTRALRRAQGAREYRENPFAMLAAIGATVVGLPQVEAELLLIERLTWVNQLREWGFEVTGPPERRQRGRRRTRTPEHFGALLDAAAAAIIKSPRGSLKVIVDAMSVRLPGMAPETVARHLRWAWIGAGYRRWEEFRRAVLRAHREVRAGASVN